MNGSDQVEVRCDFGQRHQFGCVSEKRAENHVGGRFELVVADGSLCTWKYPRHQRMVCVRCAWTTQKCFMGRSALESSPHQKTHKVDQIHVARLDLLSVRCGTPDKVCRETGHLPRISGCSCPPRLIWVKGWQWLAMVNPKMLWTSHEDHTEHGHCGSGDSMRIFSVGYDQKELLRA